MKLGHALGFLLIGTVMWGLPQIAPGLCPRNGFDGTSARELWLRVMGMLQGGMGGAVVLRSAVGAVIAFVQAWPAMLAELYRAILPEPETDLAELEDADASSRSAEVVAVDFTAKPTWDQRRAA